MKTIIITLFMFAGLQAGGIHYRPSIEAEFIQGENIANNISNKLVFLN